MKPFLLLATFMAVSFHAVSQLYIGPVTGLQIDLKNHQHFKMWNVGLQAAYVPDPHVELTFTFAQSFGMSHSANDSAFSAELSLPVYTKAQKSMRASAFTVAFGGRFPVTDPAAANVFSVIVQAGFASQQVKVTYDYDKRYTILNPDQTLSWNGAYAAGGAAFMHHFGEQRLFLQLLFNSRLIRREKSFPSSFGYMAPMSINVGYSLPIHLTKHEK